MLRVNLDAVAANQFIADRLPIIDNQLLTAVATHRLTFGAQIAIQSVGCGWHPVDPSARPGAGVLQADNAFVAYVCDLCGCVHSGGAGNRTRVP